MTLSTISAVVVGEVISSSSVPSTGSVCSLHGLVQQWNSSMMRLDCS